jgi:hypothetical protein
MFAAFPIWGLVRRRNADAAMEAARSKEAFDEHDAGASPPRGDPRP